MFSYAIATGSLPYSSRFKSFHTRVATKWCAFLAIIGHWIIGKRVFIRLPEIGIRNKVPIIVVMRHVSTNDVVLSPFVFGWMLGFNLRMVMKKELLVSCLVVCFVASSYFFLFSGIP